MNLVHVASRVDREASGPSYSVVRLCEALATIGNEVELSCLAVGRAVEGVRVDVHAQWPILERFAVSPGHTRALRCKAGRVDVVHNHGLWSMVNVASGWVVPGRGAHLVTSPRGTLSPWAMRWHRWRKKAMWPLQRRVLERADLLHATSENEYDDIRARDLRPPVAIIPNGIDLPDLPLRARCGPRRLLFLGRLHPIKGIDRLLAAWRAVQDQHLDWRLVIAGGGGVAGYERDLRRLAAELAVQRVTFPGPFYGIDKSRSYFDADLFALPSHSENFGVVVAEALAHGCPVVASKSTPWQGLEAEGCGWWVDNDAQSLAATLDAALSRSPNNLAAMGENGRAWMARDFSWQSVARRMDAAYRWLLERGEAPDWVRLA